MKTLKKIRVLIVDDSMVFREALSRGIAKDPSIEVVATASDAYDARDKILKYRPDIMTLDVEMPKMNGIEFLKKLLPQYPIPVVVISSVSSNVFDALNAGAIDFITKPGQITSMSPEGLINELIVKIKIASSSKLIKFNQSSTAISPTNKKITFNSNTIIAIGASTGGTEALFHLLKDLPKNMPGIVIVQHMPPVFTKMYAERLNNSMPLEVLEAKTGDMIKPGRVLIAPGEHQMKVRRTSSGFDVTCIKGPKVSGHCPSVDVLFDSVAANVGKNSLGIILTGMGGDGAKGLLAMKVNGSYTLGQNESTCVVYGMPKVAYNLGAIEKQLPLDQIPKFLTSLL
jgi:two-component system chemotaxis response regulator CheB